MLFLAADPMGVTSEVAIELVKQSPIAAVVLLCVWIFLRFIRELMSRHEKQLAERDAHNKDMADRFAATLADIQTRQTDQHRENHEVQKQAIAVMERVLQTMQISMQQGGNK